jgi:hypothetical protein
MPTAATPRIETALVARRQALEATVDALNMRHPMSVVQRLAGASTGYRGKHPDRVRAVIISADLVTIVRMDWKIVLSTAHRLPVMPRVGQPIEGYVI